MQAVIKSQKNQNARDLRPEKELVKRFVAVALCPDGSFTEPVDARVYMSRSANGASPVYASVWINDRASNTHISGRGMSSGYGFDKPSAAIGSAIESAGIELSEQIEGRGDSAVRDAITAICAALGYSNIHIIN